MREVDNKNNTNPPTTRRLDVKQTEATTRQNKTEAFIVVRRPAARGGVVRQECQILFRIRLENEIHFEARNLFAQDDGIVCS